MPAQIQRPVDFGHAHAFRAVRHLDNFVAGSDFALFQHPEIKSRPVLRDQQRRHPRFVHADSHAVASHPWLRDLKQRPADAKPVPDAHFVVGPALDRKVLSKLSVRKIRAAEFPLPVTVGIQLIDKHRPVRPAMPSQIPLSISINVQASYH